MTKEKDAIAGLHVVRYGTAADQKFLVEFLDTYDELVINANMVAHIRAALADFLSTKAKGKPFFIDPQTHAFQHDISNLISTSQRESIRKNPPIKRSIQRLLDAYGDPVSRVVASGRPLLPGDFRDKGETREFCRRVLEFQQTSFPSEVKESDASKYFEFRKKKQGIQAPTIEPSLVVAPYFFISSATMDSWLTRNIECGAYCLEHRNRLPVGIQIVISQDILLNESRRGQLISEYKQLQPDVFLVWIDQFSEHEASEELLLAYVKLIRGLESTPVVNVYGGFLSVALGRCGILSNLGGVAHGLGYGEDRPVIPVGGGIPTAKYYSPVLHRRLAFRDALRAVRALGGMKTPQDFYKNVCDCAECREVIKRNPETDFEEYGKSRPIYFTRMTTPIVMDYPLPQTRDRCLRHYMKCKHREYTGTLSLESVLDDLKKGKGLEKHIGLDSVSHCLTWDKVLRRKGP